MQETRSEYAGLFYVVLYQSYGVNFRKVEDFAWSSLCILCHQTMAKQERHPVDRRSSLVIVQRSSFILQRSWFRFRALGRANQSSETDSVLHAD